MNFKMLCIIMIVFNKFNIRSQSGIPISISESYNQTENKKARWGTRFIAGTPTNFTLTGK